MRVREGEDVCEPVIVLMLAEGSSDGGSMKKFLVSFELVETFTHKCQAYSVQYCNCERLVG